MERCCDCGSFEAIRGWLRAVCPGLAILLWASLGWAADQSLSEDDWSLPDWVQASVHAGLFSESASPALQVNTRVVDLTWRQLQPQKGQFSRTMTDEVYGTTFESWNQQLAGSDPYWLRLWISGRDWAPQWVQQECNVQTVGTGYMNDPQLPIWNTCFWGHALELYREVLLRRGLRADPRLKLVYVPGAFTYCEFDFEMMNAAVEAGTLNFQFFNNWFQQMTVALVGVMNGENALPDDDYAYKLVFTGEDYPFGPWGRQDDFLARDAVTAGMGIRTGISEVFNFHLSEVPAYGARIAQDGHLVTDESWPLLQDPRRVVATENECYNACGFQTDVPYYAVKMSNLKALQLRVNWLYVVPTDSYMNQYSQHWNWVRLSLGKTVRDTPDVWAALRDAEDTYWREDDAIDWTGKPFVRNLERWLVQREVAPDRLSRRGSDVRSNVLGPENGTAYEGLATNLAAGSSGLAFDVDDRWPVGSAVPVQAKVTYLDAGQGDWSIVYASASGPQTSATVQRSNSGGWKTATLALPQASFDDTLAGSTDFHLVTTGPADLQVRFVRLIRLDPLPQASTGMGLGWGMAVLGPLLAIQSVRFRRRRPKG